MKIEIAPATGRPEPQFTVIAESQIEKLILKTFIDIKQDSKSELQFHLHGSCRSQDNSGITSFNFGWIVKSDVQYIAPAEADQEPPVTASVIDTDPEPEATYSPIVPEAHPPSSLDRRRDHGTATCLNPECGRTFTRKREDQKCCNTKCRNRYQAKKFQSQQKQKVKNEEPPAPDDPDPALVTMYFDDPAIETGEVPEDGMPDLEEATTEPVALESTGEVPPWYRKRFNIHTGFREEHF